MQAEEYDIEVSKENEDDAPSEYAACDSRSDSGLSRAPLTTRFHHSGVRFPVELISRFGEDLSKRDHFKRKYEKIQGKNCYGPARPQMSLNLHSEEADRKLVVAAAMFYNEVKKRGKCSYAHHHHPDWLGHEGTCGIDCSNFSSHLYNLCLGVRFTSAITAQSQMDLPKVKSWSALRPGDLAFFKCKVGHVGVCVEGPGKPSVIHSTSLRFRGKNGPTLASNHKGWPINRFSHGFRFEHVRKKAAEVIISTRIQGDSLTQAELRKRVLDFGVHTDQLNKAEALFVCATKADDKAAKDVMMQLIVDMVMCQQPKFGKKIV
jgi:hypothetical protein